MPENMRTYHKNGVVGVMQQGNFAYGETPALADLECYLGAKLLWNPDMTETEYYALMDEFLRDYYGAGWQYIREYIDVTTKKAAERHLFIYDTPNRIFPFAKKDDVDMDELILELIDFGVEDEYDEDEEEGSITIYGDPKSFAQIQNHLEEQGFDVVGAEFTYVPNDVKDVTPEQREAIDKMVEKLEDFDDVQTVYTNMKPE